MQILNMFMLSILLSNSFCYKKKKNNYQNSGLSSNFYIHSNIWMQYLHMYIYMCITDSLYNDSGKKMSENSLS